MKMGLRSGVYLFPRPHSSSLRCYFQVPAMQASSGRVETWGIFCTSAVRSRLACHSEGHEWGNTFSLVGWKSHLKIILRFFYRSTAHSTSIWWKKLNVKVINEHFNITKASGITGKESLASP